MALIKHAKSDRALKEAIVLDMGDLARQAERLLANARAEAAAILDQARTEAQRIIDGADKRGHAEGYARGLADGTRDGHAQGREEAIQHHAQQLQTLTRQWTQALAAWQTDRDRMTYEAQEDVLRFAFALARKVVGRVIQTDPTVVRDQVRESLALLNKPAAIEILINPADRSIVEQVLPELVASVEGCREASVRDDPSMAQGGCAVVTAGGRVDSSIETQLARIAEALVPGGDSQSAFSSQPDGVP